MRPTRYISRLRLSAFRNYPTAALDAGAGHVVLTGPNGAGKTNLLEAVSLLAPGRGLRRAGFDLMRQNGSDTPWAVAATIETEQGPVDLGTGPSEGTAARRVRINGANARGVEQMSDYLRLLWLTPDMDGLFRGGASDRRRFFDRLVMTLIPDHGLAVNRFEQAMRQRNRALEEGADAAWLKAIEAQMAISAAAIHFARIDSLGHLQALAAQSVDEAAFPAAQLHLTAMLDLQGDMTSSSRLEAELGAVWARNRAVDKAAGRTIVGPHRVDFAVAHAQKQMPAALCSTGEQKALLIGLVLAHARLIAQMTRIIPILLLDEVAAHLDPDRRAALFTALDDLGAQCWMTGTDPELFRAAKNAQAFRVEQGMIREI